MLNSLMTLRAPWRRIIFDMSRIITRFGVSASSLSDTSHIHNGAGAFGEANNPASHSCGEKPINHRHPRFFRDRSHPPSAHPLDRMRLLDLLAMLLCVITQRLLAHADADAAGFALGVAIVGAEPIGDVRHQMPKTTTVSLEQSDR